MDNSINQDFNHYWDDTGEVLARLFIGTSPQKLESLKLLLHAAFDMGRVSGAQEQALTGVVIMGAIDNGRVN